MKDKYCYDEILKKIMKEIKINPQENVYGITFFAGPGYGKSTVAKMLSEKLGVVITANDYIRRVYEELGFNNDFYESDIKRMANDRTKLLLKNKTSMIIDANMEFFWEMAEENFKNHNAKLYFIELECSEETIINRIKRRKEKFDSNPENFSRADLKDYYLYLEKKKNQNIPKEKIFYTIDMDKGFEELEIQVNELVKKIKEA